MGPIDVFTNLSSIRHLEGSTINRERSSNQHGWQRSSLGVTSRQVVWLFPEQLWFEFVPILHRLQGRLAAQG